MATHYKRKQKIDSMSAAQSLDDWLADNADWDSIEDDVPDMNEPEEPVEPVEPTKDNGKAFKSDKEKREAIEKVLEAAKRATERGYGHVRFVYRV